ncbi:aliphatic sulfonate ABC transporter substrate-binding protein, partial [Klebsiella pneumoniae]
GLLAQQSASADASLRFLAPADAHAAFARGDVDAWAVWDPLLSDAIGQGARLLADARGISANYYFCMAGRALAADRAALDTILATLRRVERWT